MHLHTGVLAWQVGLREISRSLRPKIRPTLERAVAELGLEEYGAVRHCSFPGPTAWALPSRS
ncbi:hypothetical protein [Streptosporangium sp. NBC_01469]|uniref:hypothetical protein n=1 Tax=Streptosporangium sp. NBC_01469 TaxID=2903898 RepID=UPI002E28B16F|nr:hypothetical protein [Streptosporangium sp. NBC_01469]